MDKRRDGSRALEASVESHLERQMRRIGGRAFKFPPAVKGMPDRIVVFPHGRIIFVELKRRGEKPSPAQRLQHARLLDMGHVVHVLDSKAQVDAFVAWAVGMHRAEAYDDTEAIKNRYYSKEES